MGKTHFTKHDDRKRLDDLEKKRKELMEKNQMDEGAVSLSTLNQLRKFYGDYDLSRHPKGTKATGLRKVLRNKSWTVVSFPRERFGLAEEKSSRLRGGRRNVHKAARQESQKEIDAALEE